MANNKIAFIGAGHMATALINGLIRNHFPAKSIWASNPSAKTTPALQQSLGVHQTASNSDAMDACDTIVLAVKPQILPEVLPELRKTKNLPKKLIVSIAAGVSTDAISDFLSMPDLRIIRAMPNVPALVNCGATGLFANQAARESDRETVETLFRSVGTIAWIDSEDQMDIVTALSGSGPAYFFTMMHALSVRATELGLPAHIASLLTEQTILGAARLALDSEKDVQDLTASVTSKGGTTEHALRVFEMAQFDALCASVLDAAYERGKALSEEFKTSLSSH